MTFNLNFGGPGPGESLAAIRGEAPDLLCFQETTPAWELYLRSKLGIEYPHMQFHHSRGAGGLAILSRWPLRKQEIVPSPVGWFPAALVEAETPLGPVQFMNVHLHPACNEEGRFTIGAYASTSPAARLVETRAFHPKLVSDRPAVVLGDFNEGNDGDSIEWLVGQGMTDALPEFDWHSETWHWRTSVSLSLRKRLDHILYSKGLRCCEARVVKEGASDHYPVVAVFERP